MNQISQAKPERFAQFGCLIVMGAILVGAASHFHSWPWLTAALWVLLWLIARISLLSDQSVASQATRDTTSGEATSGESAPASPERPPDGTSSEEKRVPTPPGRIVDELVLAGWFLWMVLGIAGYDAWDPADNSPLRRATQLYGNFVIGLSIPFLAYLQTLHDRRPGIPPRLLLFGLACAANWSLVGPVLVQGHDTWIEWIAAQYWMRPIGVWLSGTLLLIVAGVLFVSLSTPWAWQGGWSGLTNRFALARLQASIIRDPHGHWHARWQHALHRFAPYVRMVNLPWVIPRTLFGKLPSWIVPLDRPLYSRREQFLRLQLDRGCATLRSIERERRAARLAGREQNDIERKWDSAARLQADLLVALHDLWRCPYQCDVPTLPSANWGLWIIHAERLLMACDLVGINLQSDALANVHKRLIQVYQWRVAELISQSEVPEWILEWHRFTREANRIRQEGDSIQLDLERLRLHQVVLAKLQNGWKASSHRASSSRPNTSFRSTSFTIPEETCHLTPDRSRLLGVQISEVDWRAFAVHGLLYQFRQDADWEGLLETCLRLEHETDYVLTEEDQLDSGEAWWQLAGFLETELFEWCREQAVSCFIRARSVAHLQLASSGKSSDTR